MSSKEPDAEKAEPGGTAGDGGAIAAALMGAGFFVICCCICCLILPIIAIQVYILVTCSDAMDTDCTKKANIWLFCVWYFCGMAFLGLISALAMLVSAWLNFIQPVVATAFAVWGTQLWSSMDEECYNSYPPHSLWALVLLFKIYVVLSYLAAIGSTCTAIQLIGSGGNQPQAAGLPGLPFPGMPGAGGGEKTETSPLLPKDGQPPASR